MATPWIRRALLLLGFLILPRLDAADLTVVEMSSLRTVQYGETVQSVRVKLRVPNESFEKTISVILQKDGASPQRVVARYQGPAEPGYEIWEAFTHLSPGNHWVRAEYAELGRDGYSQQSLLLRDGAGPVIHDERMILGIYEPQVILREPPEFHVVVKNLAYKKRVRMHYSTDGWETRQTLEMSYLSVFQHPCGTAKLPNAEGFEVWSVTAHIGEESGELSYYFTYDVAGATYVDDNFGHNYTLQKR